MQMESSGLATFYLPITKSAVAVFLKEGEAPPLVIERAALFVLLHIAERGSEALGTMARLLADADEMFAPPRPAVEVEAFLRIRLDECAPDADKLHALIAEHGVMFASETQMASREWCAGTGRYTDAFQHYCRDTLIEFDLRLTREEPPATEREGEEDALPRHFYKRLRGTTDQARIAHAFTAAPDELFSLDAYAGSGKTHLLLDLAGSGGRFTHLAAHKASKYGLTLRAQLGGLRSITLWSLAHRMSKDHAWRTGRYAPDQEPRVRRSKYSHVPTRAERGGVPSLSGRTPAAVLARTFSIINRWCWSDRPHLSPDDLTDTDRAGPLAAAYLSIAQQVWESMFAPAGNPVSGLYDLNLQHLVKWLDVEGASIPTHLGALVVDEAHDLPAPWRSMLESYPGGVLLMGDPYQRLGPTRAIFKRSKQLTMFQSVRTGEQVMPMIRSVLQLHSELLMNGQIIGSRDHITRSKIYRDKSELPATGLHAYGSPWTLLANALRYLSAGVNFGILPASADLVHRFASDAIELRAGRKRPEHYDLREFDIWEELAAQLEKLGLGAVARLFERSFGHEHLAHLLACATPPEDSPQVLLGLHKHCRNLEAPIVVMSRCCFDAHIQRDSIVGQGQRQDEFVRSVYVAMTRASGELWVPGGALESLHDSVTCATKA
jgi:hypothetical protein